MERRKRLYEPVRNVNSRGSLNMTGRFSSHKMKRCCSFESAIEKDFIHLLEFDRDVVEYYEQPFWVEYTLEGKERRSCPDFIAIHTNGKEKAWEVKPADKAEEEDNKKRFKVIGKVLAREGKDFECITDDTIRAGKRLNNIKELFEYLHVAPDLQAVLALCKVFDHHDTVTLGGLLQGAYGHIFSMPTIYGLLAQRVLDLDIWEDLNDATEVQDFCLHQLLQLAA